MTVRVLTLFGRDDFVPFVNLFELRVTYAQGVIVFSPCVRLLRFALLQLPLVAPYFNCLSVVVYPDFY